MENIGSDKSLFELVSDFGKSLNSSVSPGSASVMAFLCARTALRLLWLSRAMFAINKAGNGEVLDKMDAQESAVNAAITRLSLGVELRQDVETKND